MSSRDILFITLAVAVLTATVFWVWLLYYLIKILRSTMGMVDDFRERLNMIDDILRTIKEKLTSTHTQLTFLADGLKQLMSFIGSRRASRRSSKRAENNEDDL